MTIMVWADTHFGHAGILRHCAESRPYNNVTEMNEALIAFWNETVRPLDDVYFLGDFAFDRQPLRYFERLFGYKHLVRGNHDMQNKQTLALPWVSVHDIVTLKQEGTRAIACHYPMASWEGMHRGYIMLHGHSHGNLAYLPRRFDVGVDVYRTPMPLKHFADIAKRQIFSPVDHHEDRGGEA